MTITRGNIEDLHQIYKNYESDFPENERKTLVQLEFLMRTGTYYLLLAYDETYDERMGYAFVYPVLETKQLWIDFIAIEQNYQGKGFGSILMKKLIEEAEADMEGVLLEVEIPDGSLGNSEEHSLQLRRIAFYERLGAVKLDVDYILPSEAGGTPMYLFHIPVTNVLSLGKEDIYETVACVYRFIHTDVSEEVRMAALERLKN